MIKRNIEYVIAFSAALAALSTSVYGAQPNNSNPSNQADEDSDYDFITIRDLEAYDTYDSALRSVVERMGHTSNQATPASLITENGEILGQPYVVAPPLLWETINEPGIATFSEVPLLGNGNVGTAQDRLIHEQPLVIGGPNRTGYGLSHPPEAFLSAPGQQGGQSVFQRWEEHRRRIDNEFPHVLSSRSYCPEDSLCQAVQDANEALVEQCLRELLELFAWANTPDHDRARFDSYGYGLMIIHPAHRPHTENNLLVQHNVTCGTNGDTILHIAVRNGWTNVVTLLLENGAHVDTPNRAGKTALGCLLVCLHQQWPAEKTAKLITIGRQLLAHRASTESACKSIIIGARLDESRRNNFINNLHAVGLMQPEKQFTKHFVSFLIAKRNQIRDQYRSNELTDAEFERYDAAIDSLQRSFLHAALNSNVTPMLPVDRPAHVQTTVSTGQEVAPRNFGSTADDNDDDIYG